MSRRCTAIRAVTAERLVALKGMAPEVTDHLILITLLVKLGVAGLGGQRPGARQHLPAAFLCRAPYFQPDAGVAGVFPRALTSVFWIRIIVPNFLAADISFETVILLGLLVGPEWALLGVWRCLCRPSVTMSFWRCPSTPRWGWRLACWAALSRRRRYGPLRPSSTSASTVGCAAICASRAVDRQFLMLFLIVAAEACRDWIAHAFPHRLFALLASQWLVAGAGMSQRAHCCRHCA